MDALRPHRGGNTDTDTNVIARVQRMRPPPISVASIPTALSTGGFSLATLGQSQNLAPPALAPPSGGGSERQRWSTRPNGSRASDEGSLQGPRVRPVSMSAASAGGDPGRGAAARRRPVSAVRMGRHAGDAGLRRQFEARLRAKPGDVDARLSYVDHLLLVGDLARARAELQASERLLKTPAGGLVQNLNAWLRQAAASEVARRPREQALFAYQAAVQVANRELLRSAREQVAGALQSSSLPFESLQYCWLDLADRHAAVGERSNAIAIYGHIAERRQRWYRPWIGLGLAQSAGSKQERAAAEQTLRYALTLTRPGGRDEAAERAQKFLRKRRQGGLFAMLGRLAARFR
jgi:tetratricopeptide (TPR) repeat protein